MTSVEDGRHLDIGRRVVDFLEQEGVRADYLPDVLFQEVDDEDDVMPYARDHDAVLVTANWRGFTRFEPDRHDGCLVEFGHDEPRWRYRRRS